MMKFQNMLGVGNMFSVQELKDLNKLIDFAREEVDMSRFNTNFGELQIRISRIVKTNEQGWKFDKDSEYK